MAENPHLYLKIGGTAVQGDSTQLNDGSIECLSFSFGVNNPIDWATGASGGRREYNSMAVSKRVNKTSPLLHQALCANKVVEGTFRFFHPPADGSGNSEHFYGIDFRFGRVESLSYGASDDIPTESVTFVFRAITLTFVKGGIQSADDWSKQK